MKYYKAIKKNKLLLHRTNNTVNLIDITLSKRSQKQVYVWYGFIYMQLKKRQKSSMVTEVRIGPGCARDIITGKRHREACGVLISIF